MSGEGSEHDAFDWTLARAEEMLAAGEWRAALRLLQRIERQNVLDARLFALIGDCYAAAGRWRHAIAAYERSLNIAYNPEVTRSLEEARAQASGAALLGSRRGLWLSVAAVVIAALAVALLLSSSLSPPHPRKTKAPSVSAGAPLTVDEREALAPWRPKGALQAPAVPPRQVQPVIPRPSAQPLPQQTPQAPPSVPPPVIVTKRVEAPSSDEDWYLTDIVGSLCWLDGTPLSGNCLVQFDPLWGHAFVTVMVPRSLRAVSLTETTTRMAYQVAWALFHTSAQVKYVTIRALCVLQEPARRARTVVAFRGTVARQAYDYWNALRRQPTVDEMWRHVFDWPWWNPEVPVQPQPRAEAEE